MLSIHITLQICESTVIGITKTDNTAMSIRTVFCTGSFSEWVEVRNYLQMITPMSGCIFFLRVQSIWHVL